VVVVLAAVAVAVAMVAMIVMMTTTDRCFLKGLWKCWRGSLVWRRMLLSDCVKLSSS
jgi:hypothetical protein